MQAVGDDINRNARLAVGAYELVVAFSLGGQFSQSLVGVERNEEAIHTPRGFPKARQRKAQRSAESRSLHSRVHQQNAIAIGQLLLHFQSQKGIAQVVADVHNVKNKIEAVQFRVQIDRVKGHRGFIHEVIRPRVYVQAQGGVALQDILLTQFYIARGSAIHQKLSRRLQHITYAPAIQGASRLLVSVLAQGFQCSTKAKRGRSRKGNGPPLFRQHKALAYAHIGGKGIARKTAVRHQPGVFAVVVVSIRIVEVKIKGVGTGVPKERQDGNALVDALFKGFRLGCFNRV